MNLLQIGILCWCGAATLSFAAAPESAKHWSFIPPERVGPPKVRQSEWVRNPIDNFILARLEQEKIKPSPEADRITLIRRLSLDLLGLPPTIPEVEAFVNDRRPDAYQRLVERLLASPHFGERWGRHWLDVARYADSNGYSIDAPRSIWKYRDWVIDALNRDQPFDQFVICQLAGDLLPRDPNSRNLDPIIATGFHRNTQINQEGGIDPEQFRVESVIDRVNTTGTAFLGLTIGCCQCHDHKFDPFTQKEYYRLLAFFNSTAEDGHGKGTPGAALEIPGEFEKLDNLHKEIEEAEADLERYLDIKGSEAVKWEKDLTDEARKKLKPAVREALKLAWDKRNISQKRAAYAAFRADDPEFKSRNTKLTKLEKKEPKPITTLVMSELDQPRESFVFIKGDFTRKGEVVTPGVPAILHPLKTDSLGSARVPRADFGLSPKSPVSPNSEDGLDGTPNPARGKRALPNRLDLARWIVDLPNPLTARVAVNRIWQQYFGRGLVETENDFGTQGAPPSHPQLLDWLATEFMNPGSSRREEALTSLPQGDRIADKRNRSLVTSAATKPEAWSLKHIHRLIVTSAAYRQSSRARPELNVMDPNNKLLARQSRLRLDAEVVRDVALAASGLLNDKIGGPSVFPPQPEGVMTLGQSRREWKASEGPDRYRRGMYTFFWRATPNPALTVFDAPDAFSACTRRIRSNTPLQALTLLNDQAFFEFARALADRVLREGQGSDTEKLQLAFRLCLSRAPGGAEEQRLSHLLAQQRAAEPKEREAWTIVARVLLNLDEMITRE